MKIFTKRVNFFEMLNVQSEIVNRGMEALYNYCKSVGEPNHESYGDEVIAIEHEGDDARKALIEALNRTFITPMERNDIFDFSRELDDILDYAKTTVDEMRLFGIDPIGDATEMVGILFEITQHIYAAVSNMEKHKAKAKEEALLVKSLENKVGATYYRALSSLFESDDFKYVLKYREVYRHLNTTADEAAIAMDFLLDILNSL